MHIIHNKVVINTNYAYCLVVIRQYDDVAIQIKPFERVYMLFQHNTPKVHVNSACARIPHYV